MGKNTNKLQKGVVFFFFSPSFKNKKFKRINSLKGDCHFKQFCFVCLGGMSEVLICGDASSAFAVTKRRTCSSGRCALSALVGLIRTYWEGKA